MHEEAGEAKDEESSGRGDRARRPIEGDAERVETNYRQSLSAKQRKALDSGATDEFDEVDQDLKKIPKIVIR